MNPRATMTERGQTSDTTHALTEREVAELAGSVSGDAACVDYSHIRIDAKRQALDALDATRRGEAGNGNEGNGNGEAANAAEIETVVEVADDLTSQSRHSLLLQGSPPSGKLLIPFERRDVRVVEGARLESVCTSNRTKGSNPFLSASLQPA